MHPTIDVSIDTNISQKNIDIFSVIISDKELNLEVLVTANSSKPVDVIEFKITKLKYLKLTGITNVKEFLNAKNTNSISSNSTIVQECFKDILEQYGITISKINFRNFNFFDAHSGDFRMEHGKREYLNTIIDKKLKKYFNII